MVYSGNNLVGARGFEPRLPDGELCFTGRRGQPYPPDTQKIIEPRTTLPLCALKLQTAHNAIAVRSKLAEGLGVEPSGAIYDACRGSSAVASRPPRPLWREARDSNSVIAGLESAALPVEPASRRILAEGGGIEPHGFSPVHRFRGGSATIHRCPLCIQIWCPRRDLHSHSRNGNWFLRPARLLFRHPGIGAPIRTRTG